MKLNVVGTKNIWFAFSSALVLASVLCISIFGLKFGIDFTGGSLLEIDFENDPQIAETRTVIEELGYSSVTVQQSGDSSTMVRMQTLTEQEHQSLVVSLKEKFGNAQELRFESIGPVIGNELRQKSLIAVVLMVIAIILYIAWAFRKVSKPVSSWKYGFVTVFAAIHDVIIPIGIFSVLGKFFGFEIGTGFIAAVLTILGYSINDTIVVFDRIRENLSRRKSGETFVSLVNYSLNQTLVRSINTSFTTLLALVAVFFFGGDTTKEFSLALILGIIFGTYSSIFLASPLLVVLGKSQDRG
ncbi:MAG: hypothetical protein ACD_76C00097G0004 [uncultured bacterium]|nr:MAG: hypothetical protein ACD_76C00097G0004 [uncultured bacterium]HBD05702.1 protein translocase subunit SecF [Candidatus Uhrbacteria bacterium]